MNAQYHAGQRVGEYRLDSFLGEGGFGVVWSANHGELPGKRVALKLPQNPTVIDWMKKEGLIQYQLNHPSIVEIVGQDLQGEIPYVAMELVSGTDLRAQLSKGPLPIDKAWRILEGILQGLGVAHASNVVHADLKPENVLVTDEGQVKLTDFGLARSLLASEVQNSVSTKTSPGLAGTLRYLAPELFQLGQTASEQSDLYSLAIVLFEMLVGRCPQGNEKISDHRPEARAFDALFLACYCPVTQRLKSVAEAWTLIDKAQEGSSVSQSEVISVSVEETERRQALSRLLAIRNRDLSEIETAHRALMKLDAILQLRLIRWLVDQEQHGNHLVIGLALLCVSDNLEKRRFALKQLTHLPMRVVAEVVDYVHGKITDRRHVSLKRKRFKDSMTSAYEATSKKVRESFEVSGTSGDFSGGEILVTLGCYDKVQQVLDYLELPYQTMPCKIVNQLAYRADQVLIVNCPGQFDAEGIAALRNFVKVGGTLITTDWALKEVLEKAFPGVMKFNGKSTTDDVVTVSWIDPDSVYTRGVEVKDHDIQWWLEGGSYPIEILDPRVRVLMKSEAMGQKYKDDVLVAKFAYGEGTVFHLTSHYYLQRSQGDKSQKNKATSGPGASEMAAAYSSLRLLGNILFERRRVCGVS